MSKDFENLQVGDEIEEGVFVTEEMLAELSNGRGDEPDGIHEQ